MCATGFVLAGTGRARSQDLPKVGVLVAGTPDPAPFLKEFRAKLRGLGYVEGRNVQMEIRSAGSTASARLRASVQELIALKVAVLVTFQTPPTEAAKEIAHDVPIVMAGVGDPVGTGLVASLVRPGGNITGVSSATSEVVAKNVDLLHELLPAARRFGALCNADDPFSKPFLENIRLAGKSTKVDIHPAFAHGASEVDAAFAQLLEAKVDAVVVQPSLGVQRAAELTLKHRVAGACPIPPFVRAGGLLSYSADRNAIARLSAAFADRILKGAKPADLPVEQPTEFELAVNLKTAKALGLSVPPAILVGATEVIE